MGEKQDLIKRMLELQKKFIDYEQQNGVGMHDYYTPDADHPLANYRQEYADLATKVVDLAHGEAGSSR